ncbi:MAG: redoxin family protein [Chitinophagaceae bacterium]|nr:redoxin family protein [Chitinophagaceae bacterium]
MLTSDGQQAIPGKANNKYDRFLDSPFPAMDFETIDSSIFNTSALAHKTVYVDFWFTACPPCLKQIPYAKQLHAYFASDTNVVFLNVCIENVDRKQVWKTMVKEKAIGGINVFYARNRPQKINLLRQFNIVDYPTCLLLNNLYVIGYDAPAPSEKGWVHWAIYEATKNIPLPTSYALLADKSKVANDYLYENWSLIEGSKGP